MGQLLVQPERLKQTPQHTVKRGMQGAGLCLLTARYSQTQATEIAAAMQAVKTQAVFVCVFCQSPVTVQQLNKQCVYVLCFLSVCVDDLR